MSEIDSDLTDFLESQGYVAMRLMPDGSIAGINKFLFTYGLCTKLDFCGYEDRWCFDDKDDAIGSLLAWNGLGDPPGNWKKQKGLRERHNPKLYNIIVINRDGSEYAERKA